MATKTLTTGNRGDRFEWKTNPEFSVLFLDGHEIGCVAKAGKGQFLATFFGGTVIGVEGRITTVDTAKTAAKAAECLVAYAAGFYHIDITLSGVTANFA